MPMPEGLCHTKAVGVCRQSPMEYMERNQEMYGHQDQVPLDGVTFSLSSKIASFYVSHKIIWYEGVTLASHGRGKSQNTRYANDVAEFV